MTDPQGTPLPRSVLIVTGVENGPFRYRVSNLLGELRLLGIPATVLFHHDQDALQAAGEHELVFFQRVPGDEYVDRLVARARSSLALPIFGIDDLLFEPERLPPFVGTLDREERKNWAGTARSYRRVFDACDAFVGSTDVLARTAAALGKTSFVHRNALSQELIDISEIARLARRPAGTVRLGYFSGTRTHSLDFGAIASAIANVFVKRPAVRLEVVGPLELPPALGPFSERIHRRPVVPWRDLPALLSGVDVNLAPLELDERFCHAKSELKWFEAAVAGVATIASPTEPFRYAIRDGENGMLAETPEQWESRLLALVDDGALRDRLARTARADALARYQPETSARRLEQTLRALNALRPSRKLRPGPPILAGDLAALKASGLGIGKTASEPPDAVAGPEQLATRHASEAIRGAITASQTFTCPPGNLYRIDLLVGTHQRLNSHDLVVRLLEAKTGEQLAYATADTGEACDNSWFAIEIEPPLSLDSQRELTVLIEAPSAPASEGLAFWYEPSPSGKGRAGTKDGLDLAFRTWLRPPGWSPPAPMEDEVAPNGLADGELVVRLAVALREEREARRQLERRLSRVEVRAAAAQFNAGQRDTALRGLRKLRGTLPYKAARRLYRMLKP